jgi:phosphoglycolate phosphatase-like HAD superfamily hydrolase
VRHLLLFDIDGTLVRGGPAKTVFESAMAAVFGTAGPINGHDFSGKTDPQIARELLHAAGLEERAIEAGFPALWAAYLDGLRDSLPGKPMTVIPGVVNLLAHLATEEGVALGLLTGNIVEGARLKLGSVDLLDYFPVGGFGSDSELREDLPAVAIERANRNWSTSFRPESVVVIGDTPRDVACGKHAGTRTVAVATGRFDEEALARTGADSVLSDMTDLAETVQVFLGS